MRKIDDLFAKLLTLDDVDFGVPVSHAEIESFERRSGIILPESYQAFLNRFGSMSVSDQIVIAGISGEPYDLHSISKKLQSEWNMPAHLLILQPNEEAPYCFDLNTPSSAGEYAIVCYQLGKSYRRIASDFIEWVEEFVLFVYGETEDTDD
jgi:hypothetical protein